MRPRFLLLAGRLDPDQATAVHAALLETLPLHRSVGSFHLFTSEATPVLPLRRSEGVLLGTAFARADGERTLHLSPAFDHAVTSTRGGQLVRSLWGSFVAIWTDPARGVCLLRSPGGTLPAFWHKTESLHLVTSDVALAAQSGLFRTEVAWDRLVRMLHHPGLPSEDTMLIDLHEAIPGTCHVLDRSADADVAVWTPGTFVASRQTSPDPREHRERVRSAVSRSVACWRACFEIVVLELSGGLDSSILAAALNRTGQTWSGLTFATAAPDGDERDYARTVAEHFGVSVREVSAGPAGSDPFTRYGRLTPRPRNTAFINGLDSAMRQAAKAAGADAVFNGLGGDHLFFSTQSTVPVLDAWRTLGRSAASNAAADLARLCAVPLADVYAHALRRALTQRLRRAPPDHRYLAGDADWRPPAHPWLKLPRDTLPGSRPRIMALLRAIDYLDGVDRMATQTMVCPLLSQPVIEACLAVPSWLCIAGGRDRALARDAFADQLPEAVLHRRDKGRLDSLLVGRFAQHRGTVRALLLDGVLAGAGLLDRRAIERDLERPASDRDPFQDRLMLITDAELWARAVLDQSRSMPT